MAHSAVKSKSSLCFLALQNYLIGFVCLNLSVSEGFDMILNHEVLIVKSANS